MPPKSKRSSDTPTRGSIATPADHADAHEPISSSAFGRAPSYSPAELAGFRDFAKVMRDAIGEKGMKGSVKELTPEEAAERGCLGTLKSLHRRGHVTFDEDLCKAAAGGGQFLVLKWLRENSCPWNEETCENAAHGGHLGVLKWLHANGCPWSSSTGPWAAQGGYLEILQWLRAKGFPWDAAICAGAAKGGQLEVLKWMRANGCPWDEMTCSGAAIDGHLEVLKWAREKGCPLREDAELDCEDDDDGEGDYYYGVCALAAQGGHLEVLKWLHENGYP